jgi:hypothetical protein
VLKAFGLADDEDMLEVNLFCVGCGRRKRRLLSLGDDGEAQDSEAKEWEGSKSRQRISSLDSALAMG